MYLVTFVSIYISTYYWPTEHYDAIIFYMRGGGVKSVDQINAWLAEYGTLFQKMFWFIGRKHYFDDLENLFEIKFIYAEKSCLYFSPM